MYIIIIIIIIIIINLLPSDHLQKSKFSMSELAPSPANGNEWEAAVFAGHSFGKVIRFHSWDSAYW